MTQATGSPARRFQPYPAYKPSGVDWLGPIPATWDMARLKHRCRFLGGGTPAKDNAGYWSGDIPWVSPKDMKADVVEDSEEHISEEGLRNSATRLVGSGAVLVVVRSGILRRAIPVAINLRPVALNQDMKAVVPDSGLLADYLAFVIRGNQEALLVEWRKAGATVESLEQDLLANQLVPIPPVPEQQAIAAFLDRETAKIDALAAKKERLIELLEEQRAALITHSVTRGLDPNVLMKESGVEWLGLVPAHWRIESLKRIGVLKAGAGFPDTDQGLPDEELPFYKVSDMNLAGNDVFMTNHNNSVTYASAARLGANVFAAGSIVFPKVGAALLTNKRRILTRQACLDNNMMALEVRDGLVKFLFYRLVCLDMARLSNPGAVPSLNESQAREIVVGVPSDLEQRAIAEFLDKKTAKLDALIVKIREAIEKLLEYRTALISAAVAGKIDVRGYLGSRIEGDASKRSGR